MLNVESPIFPGFFATGGVRQGCPLSLLLFAVVADVLLRHVLDRLPEVPVRAFADHAAVVTPDFIPRANDHERLPRVCPDVKSKRQLEEAGLGPSREAPAAEVMN